MTSEGPAIKLDGIIIPSVATLLLPGPLQVAAWRFVRGMPVVAFLIDGFNLYHSLREAAVDGSATRWLDIRALCGSYMSAIGGGAQLGPVEYFSALANHLRPENPEVVARHQQYIRALRGSGVVVQLHRFKKKTIRCTECNARIKRHEEKETDVAISVRLLEILHSGAADAVALVTGDTDVVPAIRAANRMFPENPVYVLFPFDRRNRELESVAQRAFTIKAKTYEKFQFSDPYVLPNGKVVSKPASW